MMLIPLYGEEETYVKTYPVQWNTIDGLHDTISEFIGDKGKVFKYSSGNEFIISTTEHWHKQVDTLLKELDKPVPNVRIEVTMSEAGSSRDSGFGVKGSGKVLVSRKGGNAHFQFTPEARNQSTTMSSITKQTLLIQSGRSGSLHVGEEIPYAEWLFFYGRDHGYIASDVQLETEKTGAMLEASPQVIGSGPLINITLTPVLRTLVNGRHRHFRFTGASTTVTASHGKPVQIGGVGRHRDLYDRLLTSYSSSGGTKSTSITLTPFINFPDGSGNLK
ncbi:hypothetical protein BVX97_05240 [bacterium E08(2017)]|nr:hypothetical protein BVX97_05240 [bacterium E08(2017)]